jgi:hypothetical protein
MAASALDLLAERSLIPKKHILVIILLEDKLQGNRESGWIKCEADMQSNIQEFSSVSLGLWISSIVRNSK